MAPASSAPPPLAPSVEEAYRRKCIQLKQRTSEVEESNDGARLRLARLRRQVEKMRLERAFLLEQLAKRTSPNVEDSDGSPSPPPTPQEKPLRTKRGHRKPSVLNELQTGSVAGSTFINQNLTTLSPSSDAFSHSLADGPSRSQKDGKDPKDGDDKKRTNGTSKSKQPASLFEFYCADVRDAVLDDLKDKDEEDQLESKLAALWKELPDDELETYKERWEEFKAEQDDSKNEKSASRESSGRRARDGEPASQAEDTPQPATQDEDVEMGNYDTEPEPTPRANAENTD